MCGVITTLGSLSRDVRLDRFDSGNVEAGAAEMTGAQRLGHLVLVNHRARGVDEIAPRFIAANSRRPMSGGSRGLAHIERDEVRFGEQAGEVNGLGARCADPLTSTATKTRRAAASSVGEPRRDSPPRESRLGSRASLGTRAYSTRIPKLVAPSRNGLPDLAPADDAERRAPNVASKHQTCVHIRQRPARTKRSPSATRRAVASIRAKARSAVVSVSTPGV